MHLLFPQNCLPMHVYVHPSVRACKKFKLLVSWIHTRAQKVDCMFLFGNLAAPATAARDRAAEACRVGAGAGSKIGSAAPQYQAEGGGGMPCVLSFFFVFFIFIYIYIFVLFCTD